MLPLLVPFGFFVQLSCGFSVINHLADRAIAALLPHLRVCKGEESPGSIG